MVNMRNRGSPIFLLLFALPFIGVGIFMGGLTLRTIQRAHQMEQWMEVPATILAADLEQHRGDDSTTYRVTARYRYWVDGRSYEGTRVGLQGGSDNIGHWHQERYAELQAAQAGRRALTCRVNPARPAEAILFPRARTGMVVFYGAFAVTFGGAGLAIFLGGLATLRKQRYAATAPAEEPWKQRPDWAGGMIKSRARVDAWAITFMAVIWNSIAWIMVGVMGRELLRQGGPALLFILFPLIGVILAVVAVRYQLVARRYGSAVFQMAPVPGVLGGRLAGLVRLPESARPPEGFAVKVKCTRTTRSGKNSTTTEIWQNERRLNPDALPLVDVGQALPVLFALPYDMPASSTWDGGGVINWWLEIRGRQPGIDVDVKFEIPVFKTEDSRPDFILDEKPIAAFELR